MKEKCKHDFGWIVPKNINLFVHENGELWFNWVGYEAKASKVKVVCNYPECKAERNIYIPKKIHLTYGKIKLTRKTALQKLHE